MNTKIEKITIIMDLFYLFLKWVGETLILFSALLMLLVTAFVYQSGIDSLIGLDQEFVKNRIVGVYLFTMILYAGFNFYTVFYTARMVRRSGSGMVYAEFLKKESSHEIQSKKEM